MHSNAVPIWPELGEAVVVMVFVEEDLDEDEEEEDVGLTSV